MRSVMCGEFLAGSLLLYEMVPPLIEAGEGPLGRDGTIVDPRIKVES
jgi:hypothetical protein